MRRISPLTTLLALLSLFAGVIDGALAADHQFITSVAAIYESNDNIKLDASDELSDNICTIAPKLEFVRHSERYTARADGKLEFYRYQEYDAFDDMDQWYNGFFEATPTERWRLGADLHASDDNRPDRDVAETGLVLSNIRRRRISAGASAFYTFTERLAGGMVLEFSREDFDDPETSDSKEYHVMLAATRQLDDWLPRTAGRLNLGYSHYEFEREFQRTDTDGIFEVNTRQKESTAVESVALTAGTESALTEKLDLLVDLGGRYSQSKRDLNLSRTYVPPLITEAPARIDDTYDSFGFVGKINLGYRGERSRCDLLLSHDLQPVSGSNATANRTTVRLGGRLRLLERLTGSLFFKWYRNENHQDDPAQQDINTQTWHAGGGLRWALNDYFDLAADYTYTIYDNREADTTAYRNKAVILLEAHHDWLE